MPKRNFIISLLIILLISSSLAVTAKDERLKQSEYYEKVLKEEEKEDYGRRVWNQKTSGYMKKQEYEELSKYKDKSKEKTPLPKTVKPSNLKYVPEPTYKIVRYNDPPGSPELNITKKIYKLRQYNGQGITAPNYSIMVYPAVYYYPDNNSMSSDLFVIPLEKTGTPLDKIKRANVVKRLPNPIISTDKSINNSTEFRSLTPIDFSKDSTKLLAKEKIGSSADGIWQTNAIVYDFETNTSYNLVEVRDAIIYYWKENKKLNLDEYRWDIVPLGFLDEEPDRVVVCGYAYTGKNPVFLGMWSIDSHGEQSRLISFNIKDVKIGINGFKIVQDTVVKPVIIEHSEKAQKKAEKKLKKMTKAKEKAERKILKQEHKEKVKLIEEQFDETQKDLKLLNGLDGSTELNDIPEEYKKLKKERLEKEIKQLEKEYQRRQKEIEKKYN